MNKSLLHYTPIELYVLIVNSSEEELEEISRRHLFTKQELTKIEANIVLGVKQATIALKELPKNATFEDLIKLNPVTLYIINKINPLQLTSVEASILKAIITIGELTYTSNNY